MKVANPKKQGSESGITLVEVLVAMAIVSLVIAPLLLSIGDARRRVRDGQIKRVMKQLMEYKLAHILLDRPPEGEEPIYVDGIEGNFGEDFERDIDKAYWFDERYFDYWYRIDSEEVDLGAGGGVTGFEEDFNEPEPEPTGEEGALGEEAAMEEDMGQLRYRVTLTVSFDTGNANFTQRMMVVTYVRHPQQAEDMTGPDMSALESEGVGGAEASGGAGASTSATASSSTSSFTSASSGSGDRVDQIK